LEDRDRKGGGDERKRGDLSRNNPFEVIIRKVGRKITGFKELEHAMSVNVVESRK
jgi:hypothetical protein